MKSWIKVGNTSEIERQGARVVCSPEGRIAVFRTLNDEFFALEDRCPHRNGPLSDGIIHGTTVTCPLHDWAIEMNTGCAAYPDEGKVKRYALRVENGEIFIRDQA